MVTECEVFMHVHNVHCILLVLFFQVFQYPNLFLGLAMKPFLITYHFQGNMLVRFMVVRLDNLPEASLPDHLQYLVPIRNMVMRYMHIGTLVIIISTIAGTPNNSLSLLSVGSHKVDLGVIEDFMMFKR
jgi:hypothetical protein